MLQYNTIQYNTIQYSLFNDRYQFLFHYHNLRQMKITIKPVWKFQTKTKIESRHIPEDFKETMWQQLANL